MPSLLQAVYGKWMSPSGYVIYSEHGRTGLTRTPPIPAKILERCNPHSLSIRHGRWGNYPWRETQETEPWGGLVTKTRQDEKGDWWIIISRQTGWPESPGGRFFHHARFWTTPASEWRWEWLLQLLQPDSKTPDPIQGAVPLQADSLPEIPTDLPLRLIKEADDQEAGEQKNKGVWAAAWLDALPRVLHKLAAGQRVGLRLAPEPEPVSARAAFDYWLPVLCALPVAVGCHISVGLSLGSISKGEGPALIHAARYEDESLWHQTEQQSPGVNAYLEWLRLNANGAESSGELHRIIEESWILDDETLGERREAEGMLDDKIWPEWRVRLHNFFAIVADAEVIHQWECFLNGTLAAPPANVRKSHIPDILHVLWANLHAPKIPSSLLNSWLQASLGLDWPVPKRPEEIGSAPGHSLYRAIRLEQPFPPEVPLSFASYDFGQALNPRVKSALTISFKAAESPAPGWEKLLLCEKAAPWLKEWRNIVGAAIMIHKILTAWTTDSKERIQRLQSLADKGFPAARPFRRKNPEFIEMDFHPVLIQMAELRPAGTPRTSSLNEAHCQDMLAAAAGLDEDQQRWLIHLLEQSFAITVRHQLRTEPAATPPPCALAAGPQTAESGPAPSA